jgi:hypothetical protein
MLAAFLCLLPTIARAAGARSADTGLLSPPLVGGKPVRVQLSFFLTNLIDVDEVKERFEISGYLFLTWKDPRLMFNADGAARQKTYNANEIWVPHLLMINATEGREKTSVNIKGGADGTLHYVERFHADLTTSYFLEAFPFDRESLEIFLQPVLDERDTMAIAYDKQLSGIGTEPFVELAQWKILGLKATLQRRELGKTGKYISEIEIDLIVQRRYRYYIWKVFLPLLFMVAIAYSAFWIKISDYYTQISITLTAILTEIAFLFAISGTLPKVPYLTFIDAFFLVSFVFSCASMVELVAVHQALEFDLSGHAERLRAISRWLYPLIYVALIVLAVLSFFGRAAFR